LYVRVDFPSSRKKNISMAIKAKNCSILMKGEKGREKYFSTHIQSHKKGKRYERETISAICGYYVFIRFYEKYKILFLKPYSIMKILNFLFI
jgi:hypothetical protein